MRTVAAAFLVGGLRRVGGGGARRRRRGGRGGLTTGSAAVGELDLDGDLGDVGDAADRVGDDVGLGGLGAEEDLDDAAVELLEALLGRGRAQDAAVVAGGLEDHERADARHRAVVGELGDDVQRAAVGAARGPRRGRRCRPGARRAARRCAGR